MKKIVLLVAVLFLFILLLTPVFFYLKKEDSEKKVAIEKCIEACRQAILGGIDMTNGPCLLNPIEEIPNWVCDVVHNPRQEIDNLPENQCSLFREEKAKHFVEVSINCELVRVV